MQVPDATGDSNSKFRAVPSSRYTPDLLPLGQRIVAQQQWIANDTGSSRACTSTNQGLRVMHMLLPLFVVASSNTTRAGTPRPQLWIPSSRVSPVSRRSTGDPAYAWHEESCPRRNTAKRRRNGRDKDHQRHAHDANSRPLMNKEYNMGRCGRHWQMSDEGYGPPSCTLGVGEPPPSKVGSEMGVSSLPFLILGEQVLHPTKGSVATCT